MNSDNKNIIEDAWLAIINNVKDLRIKYKNLDGLKYWEKIKVFLSEIDSRSKSNIVYNPDHLKIKNQFYEDFKKQVPELNSKGELIEPNHFLLQLINIPYKDDNKVSFRRFMQIALNIGQFYPFNNINYFSQDILNFIKNNHLFNIKTYMTPDHYNKFLFTDIDLIKLNNILDKLKENPPLKQNGGGIIKRYLIEYY